ncbi:MAG: hypothetical protein CMLOHMNK_02427 [Steroidobacteraceae bacterium]|nr:hypothetical protein [Steroidobacteraceae bacterium]
MNERKTGIAGLLLCLAAAGAMAGPREQAKRMHDRLAGVPPTEAVLQSMANDIAGGNPEAAAEKAMANRAFYDVTLKNFATPWSNRDQTVFAPLNDYTATVIGMVRDDVPFNTALSADLVYVSNAPGLPAYSAVNNDHYAQAESRGVDLKATLVQRQQSALLGIPAAATAGLITTRASSEAFFINGTNRAMFRFTMMNHLCHDLEQLQDPTLPPDRIRQDVSRSPGGDSRVYLNNCIGCHTGLEPMAQAFAYYDFDETQQRLVYTPGTPNAKYFVNADNFKPGYITPDDHWDNYWRKGHNRILGWGWGTTATSGSGMGAKSMGEELANSEAFATCQVQKVFKAVCFRAPQNSADRSKVAAIAQDFRSNNYRMKTVFAETAAYCMGQ